MATAAVLDFDKILAPIPGDNPAGGDLRADSSPISDYYTIRDARKAASDIERRIDQGDFDSPPPDWRSVKERGVKVLAEKSKDLEISAYLIESLVRIHGFAGIRDGFKAACGLLERFWDHLYPVAEDSDVEGRFSHVLWLNGIDRAGTLIVPITKISLTADTPSGEYSLANYYQGQATAKIADPKVRQKKIDDGAITVEAIQRAVAESPPKFYADLVEDIEQSLTEFERFCTVLSEKSGYDPPSSDLRNAINEFLDVVKDIARDKIPKVTPSVSASTVEASVPSSDDGQPSATQVQAPVPVGAIVSRDDALLNLEKIADYFRKTEPHSIIPFALEQIVAWGRMSLPELLAELIPDDGPRKNLFKQVGIRAASEAAKK
jgi:type VI secretion system protein ImpA